MDFKIVSINDNGSVDVIFYDGIKQNLSGLAVSDEVTLLKQLEDYAVAYKSGHDSQMIEIPQEVKSLEGNVYTVSEDLINPVKEVDDAKITD